MSCSMTTAVMPSRAHDRGDRVHDLALVARAHPAGRLVEEEELGPQRIGDRDVEQLALALRQAARQHRCLAVEAELAEHLDGLVAHLAGRARRAPRCLRVLPSREKIDSATLSKAVSSSNRLTSWKLRAMPALMRSVHRGVA